MHHRTVGTYFRITARQARRLSSCFSLSSRGKNLKDNHVERNENLPESYNYSQLRQQKDAGGFSRKFYVGSNTSAYNETKVIVRGPRRGRWVSPIYLSGRRRNVFLPSDLQQIGGEPWPLSRPLVRHNHTAS